MTDALPADAVPPGAAPSDAALTSAAPAVTAPAGDGWPAWAGPAGARAWRAPALAESPLAFHRALPGYRPTVLADLPELAAELGAGRVFVKDESARLGLPAFKILGASWAIERALAGRARPPATLVTATDGNHGRAVARVAAQRGLAARIMIPDGVHPSAVAAIAAEGAEVVRVSGSYDNAVRRAAQDTGGTAGGEALLVQDMAWPGYTEIPAWIVEGYTTMFAEIDEQLAAAGIAGPGLVVTPAGVGSLAQAVIAHYRRPGITDPPALACAEPEQAACVQHSLRAGQLVTIETTESIMAGLNCGTPSTAAWPYLQSGLDAAIAVTDGEATVACADLARLGVPAGPCGAAPLAAVRRALAGPDTAGLRRHLGITSETVIVLLCTEGSAANPAGSPAG